MQATNDWLFTPEPTLMFAAFTHAEITNKLPSVFKGRESSLSSFLFGLPDYFGSLWNFELWMIEKRRFDGARCAVWRGKFALALRRFGLN